MRVIFPLLTTAVLLCTAAARAQDADVQRAQAGIEKLRVLVEAGAVPRAQLEQAEDALADAQDRAILRRTMSSTDLTEDQAAAMTAAAARRLARREKHLEKARRLLDTGLIARAELDPLIEEEGYARQEYDLAVLRANLCREQAAMARIESNPPPPATERFDGSGVFTPADCKQVETAFAHRFGKPLPVSAMGETAVHRAMGFDHRGRVDVAVAPDQPEGVWLRHYLAARRIPYFAFRQAEPGKATGAHIHVGPLSPRLAVVAAD